MHYVIQKTDVYCEVWNDYNADPIKCTQEWIKGTTFECSG